MEQEKISKLIKDIRLKNNLSQKEFANIFGVTYQAVSKWENGKNMPDLSVLNEICTRFNISLDEVLNNKTKTKTNLKFIITTLIIIIIFSVIVLLIINKDNFEFKTITTTCNEFSVSGSMAYNKDKSSIYISHVTYCGKDNKEIYKEIKCTLYENNNKITTEIDSCTEESNMTLEHFLKNVTFNISDYKASCKTYKENSLYLEIEAINKENKTITYKIPLSLQENCS